jgi:cold shock protein
MITGTVKWYDERRGYGFVEPDNDSECLFVCRSEASGNLFALLRENQRIAFEIVQGPQGKQAVAVELR